VSWWKSQNSYSGEEMYTPFSSPYPSVDGSSDLKQSFNTDAEIIVTVDKSLSE